jgi:DeoR/GlpR family transcriptional regulator of sugar metabolism
MDNLRIRKIVNFVKERKSCSIAELMEKFGVSSATIHRDIELLAKRDVIERVRGGIIYNDAPNARGGFDAILTDRAKSVR